MCSRVICWLLGRGVNHNPLRDLAGSVTMGCDDYVVRGLFVTAPDFRVKLVNSSPTVVWGRCTGAAVWGVTPCGRRMREKL